MSFLLKFKGKPNEYILTGTEKPIEPRAMKKHIAALNRYIMLLSLSNIPDIQNAYSEVHLRDNPL